MVRRWRPVEEEVGGKIEQMGSHTPPGYSKMWTCIGTEGEAMWETEDP